jgi:hypothetical protein
MSWVGARARGGGGGGQGRQLARPCFGGGIPRAGRAALPAGGTAKPARALPYSRATLPQLPPEQGCTTWYRIETYDPSGRRVGTSISIDADQVVRVQPNGRYDVRWGAWGRS